MEADTLTDLVNRGFTHRRMAEELNISANTVRYWLKKHNLKTVKASESWDEEKFIMLCKSENSIFKILLGMGKSPASSNYRYAHRLAKRLEIELPEYSRLGVQNSSYTLSELFSYGSKRNNQYLRRLMVSEFDIKDECFCCGQGTIWNDRPLTLQVDHIDGNNLNNVLENLRIVCPNCHTQTETFCRVKAN